MQKNILRFLKIIKKMLSILNKTISYLVIFSFSYMKKNFYNIFIYLTLYIDLIKVFE